MLVAGDERGGSFGGGDGANGDERGIMLAGQGGDPSVVFWDVVAGALQLIACVGRWVGRSFIGGQHAASGEVNHGSCSIR